MVFELLRGCGNTISLRCPRICGGCLHVPASLFYAITTAAPFSFETSVIQHLVGNNLYAQTAGDFFIDIGIKDDFLNAQYLIPAFVKR
jgi:hypothetical protein